MRSDDCRTALLSRLIDHAPMFPPASLPLGQAMAEDRRAQEGPTAWMLGRLVVPAAAVLQVPFRERALSVVLKAPLEEDRRTEALEVRPGVEPPRRDGVEVSDEEAVLGETDPEAVSLAAETFRWRDREASAAVVAAVRRDLLVSIGRCSFREPIDDLTSLGVLPL